MVRATATSYPPLPCIPPLPLPTVVPSLPLVLYSGLFATGVRYVPEVPRAVQHRHSPIRNNTKHAAVDVKSVAAVKERRCPSYRPVFTTSHRMVFRTACHAPLVVQCRGAAGASISTPCNAVNSDPLDQQRSSSMTAHRGTFHNA